MRTEIAELLRTLEAHDAEERRQGLPSAQRVRNLHPQAARFINILLKACGSRHVVEIGTSNGYSSLWWADAMECTGGRITTLEIRQGRERWARRNFAAAGVDDRVELIMGDARATLTAVDATCDFAFIDAEKVDYVTYFDLLLPMLAPGGLIVADNITSHPAETAPYLSYLRGRSDVATMTMPIARGEELTVKLRAPASPPPDAGDLEMLLHILIHAMAVREMVVHETAASQLTERLTRSLAATGGRIAAGPLPERLDLALVERPFDDIAALWTRLRHHGVLLAGQEVPPDLVTDEPAMAAPLPIGSGLTMMVKTREPAP